MLLGVGHPSLGPWCFCRNCATLKLRPIRGFDNDLDDRTTQLVGWLQKTIAPIQGFENLWTTERPNLQVGSKKRSPQYKGSKTYERPNLYVGSKKRSPSPRMSTTIRGFLVCRIGVVVQIKWNYVFLFLENRIFIYLKKKNANKRGRRGLKNKIVIGNMCGGGKGGKWGWMGGKWTKNERETGGGGEENTL